MFIPIDVDVPRNRKPTANRVLIGVICVVTLLGWCDRSVFDRLSGTVYRSKLDWSVEADREAAIEQLRHTGQVSFGPQPTFEMSIGAPIVAMTSALLHANVLHLVVNMLFLWVFGNAVNYKFRHVMFLILFCASAMVSGMTYYMTDPDVPVVGASGAIMGVVAAYLVYFPRNEISGWYVIWGRFGGIAHLPGWLVILFWFGSDVLMVALGVQTGVAYGSHIAGFLTGLALGLLFDWYRYFPTTSFEQTVLQIVREQRPGVRERG
jgi:membrane associated rhomboid family serine protease